MIKNIVGSAIVGIILTSTILAVLGIWGVVGGDVVWQLLSTLLATAIGLSAVGRVTDIYFFQGQKYGEQDLSD